MRYDFYADKTDKLTVLETVELFASFYRLGKSRVYEILDLVNLRTKEKSYVTQLSGGQKQRFSIASTLINQPKVIFLDEPTTGLDPQARIHLWEMVRQIKKNGVGCTEADWNLSNLDNATFCR